MFIDPLQALLGFCMRVSIVLTIAWMVTLVMRRASASTRQVVWASAMVCAALVPIAGAMVPQWGMTVPQKFAAWAVTSPAAPVDIGRPTPVTSPRLATGTANPPLVRATAASVHGAASRARSTYAAFALNVWAVGTVAALFYMVLGVAAVRRIRASATPIATRSARQAVQSVTALLETRSPIRVVQSTTATVPLACGVWRPLVVLPQSAAEWTVERVKVALLHEIAHIKRRDCLTQSIAHIVCAAYWFNPLVWIAARRMRLERERACDDFVLAAGTKGSDYATHLLEIARTMRPAPFSPLTSAAVAMAHRSQLEGRLMAILDPAIRRSSASYTRVAAAAGVLLMTIPVAALQPQTSPTTSSLAFDVASVKPSPDPRTVGIMRPDAGSPQPGGRWIASFATLEQMIRSAYPGHGFPGQIVGGPSWMRTDWFEVIAKADPGRSSEEMREMFRTLLADRFQLALHTETRELPAYLLVRARSDGRLGPGLRTPEIDCDAYRAAKAKGEPLPAAPIRSADRLPCVATIALSKSAPRCCRLTAGGATINGIVILIAGEVGRPVVDATGLTQLFDIEVEFSNRPLTANFPASTEPDDLPSIFDAIQSQLGLKLESGRAGVEVLVIDRAELPAPD